MINNVMCDEAQLILNNNFLFITVTDLTVQTNRHFDLAFNPIKPVI